MAGIYVERVVRGTLDEVWERTQVPEVHQRWDLRFTTIAYLPRGDGEAQKFLYETRVMPGLTVRGTGETMGERETQDGSATSALKFAAETPWALIDKGSGYWKYVPVPGGVRFLTWYDYEVRFGWVGRVVDRWGFRPALGWATAWSFDRLGMWVEEGQTPEVSLAFAWIHAIGRVGIAAVWLWHGVVPKLMFHQRDEVAMLAAGGVSAGWVGVFGWAEVVVAVVVLLTWERRWVLVANACVMAGALVGVWVTAPEYVRAAFNPVTLNGLMVVVSAMAWLAAGRMPRAGRCLRRAG